MSIRRTSIALLLGILILILMFPRGRNLLVEDDETKNSSPISNTEGEPTTSTSRESFPTSTLVATPTYGLHQQATLESLVANSDSDQIAAALLETNGYCNFPCWWGIVPGKTTLVTANNFLRSFALGVTPKGAGQYEVILPLKFSINFPEQQSRALRLTLYSNSEGSNRVVKGIFVNDHDKHDVSNILGEFGSPQSIWFWSNGAGIEGTVYLLVLSYQDSGIAFVVQGYGSNSISNQEGDFVTVCSNHYSVSDYQLWLTSPAYETTIEEMSSIILNENGLSVEMKPIEEVTQFTTREFYENFLGVPANCLLSPMDLWDDF